LAPGGAGCDRLSFETYVLDGLQNFARQYDTAKDKVWICEHNGRMIGCLVAQHRGEQVQLPGEDARVTLVSLTAKGSTLFNELNTASNRQIETLINKLTREDQLKLVGHMQAIRALLTAKE
jgi:hypothetical protein